MSGIPALTVVDGDGDTLIAQDTDDGLLITVIQKGSSSNVILDRPSQVEDLCAFLEEHAT